jgi:hypothetical protein
VADEDGSGQLPNRHFRASDASRNLLFQDTVSVERSLALQIAGFEAVRTAHRQAFIVKEPDANQSLGSRDDDSVSFAGGQDEFLGLGFGNKDFVTRMKLAS